MTAQHRWIRGWLAVMVVAALGAGCDTTSLENEGTISLAELQGQAPTVEEITAAEEVAATVEAGGEESADTVVFSETGSGDEGGSSGVSGFPAEIDGPIKWLHTDVSGWAVTASLSASVRGGTIHMPYSKSKVWPAVGGVNANPWAIVKLNGRWYAGTFEYFRYGQTSKPVGVLDGSKGDHFKVSPLSGWRPSSGERFGIMVSGLARSNARNVKERSNVSMVTWP